MENKTTYTFEDFQNIIARLRAKDGCPWDQVQTHESLRDGMLEEAYEVVEGIDIYQATGDDHNLCEELGDVLLHIVMNARIHRNRFWITGKPLSRKRRMNRRSLKECAG